MSHLSCSFLSAFLSALEELGKDTDVATVAKLHMFPLCLSDAPDDTSRIVDGDTIRFEDVIAGSSAVYQCNASNEYGYLLSNAFVNVLCK